MEVLFSHHFIQDSTSFASPFSKFRIYLRSAQDIPLRELPFAIFENCPVASIYINDNNKLIVYRIIVINVIICKAFISFLNTTWAFLLALVMYLKKHLGLSMLILLLCEGM